MAKDTTNSEVQETKAKDETRDEIEEVKQVEPEVDLPDEAPGAATEAQAEQAAVSDAGTAVAKAGKRSAKSIAEAESEAARQAAKLHRPEEAHETPPRARNRQMPNPLHQHGKKYRAAQEKIDRTTHYSLGEALELAKGAAAAKFDESVELHINLGVDPRQADQMVRATVVLPKGTGRKLRVAVFADGAQAEAARKAGADLVETDKLLAAIEKGKLDFEVLIATPDKMATLGRVAKILGPRGLMPNPKSGTVTADVAAAVAATKAGKVEYRIDKQAIIHQVIGKVSFSAPDLETNAKALLSSILQAKPQAAKGTYVKALTLSTSMGPGIKLDTTGTISALSSKK